MSETTSFEHGDYVRIKRTGEIDQIDKYCPLFETYTLIGSYGHYDPDRLVKLTPEEVQKYLAKKGKK